MPFTQTHVISVACAALSAAASAWASVPTSGNILISNNDRVFEYSRSGALVQSIPVPHPNNIDPLRRGPNGVAMSPNGAVYVNNVVSGGFGVSQISTLNPSNNSWTHTPVSYASFGLDNDICVSGNVLYGAVGEFNLTTNTWRTVPNYSFSNRSELTLGHDGLLYSISDSRSRIDVLNPANNFALVRSMLIPAFGSEAASILGIAVATDGTMIVVDGYGVIEVLSPSGAISQRTVMDVVAPTSVRLSPDQSTILVTGAIGDVELLDRSFTRLTTFHVGANQGLYGAFVVPSPPVALLTCFPFLVGARRRTR